VNLDELFQILKLEDSAHVVQDGTSRDEICGKADDLVLAVDGVDDEGIELDDVGVFRDAYEAVYLVPENSNVGLVQVVFEGNTFYLSWERFIGREIRLNS
jgi:hypothetical protein